MDTRSGGKDEYEISTKHEGSSSPLMIEKWFGDLEHGGSDLRLEPFPNFGIDPGRRCWDCDD
jgi:hypothetical protein